MTGHDREATAFTCLRHRCSGVTPECCIRRQLARDRTADCRGGWRSHLRYPGCRDCEQGNAVSEGHPGVVRRLKRLEAGGDSRITVEKERKEEDNDPARTC